MIVFNHKVYAVAATDPAIAAPEGVGFALFFIDGSNAWADAVSYSVYLRRSVAPIHAISRSVCI